MKGDAVKPTRLEWSAAALPMGLDTLGGSNVGLVSVKQDSAGEEGRCSSDREGFMKRDAVWGSVGLVILAMRVFRGIRYLASLLGRGLLRYGSG